MPEFADDEPAHCHAAGQNGAERRGEEMRLLRRGQPIILRDESANRNARELVEEREHGLPYRAADQFEIDVDTLGAGGSKLVGEARRAKIDRSIQTKPFNARTEEGRGGEERGRTGKERG